MATFLFDSIVFGPVSSRRLGVSLGINLLPVSRKVCSFNCIYCECGWTHDKEAKKEALPSRTEVYEALRKKLSEMKEQGKAPDVITYAGNGEPTLHPDFALIIDDSVALRDEFFPAARISVLSNGSMLRRKSVRDALKKVDMNILKLDSALPDTVRQLNQPHVKTDLSLFEKYVREFDGDFIIQTLFVRGECDGHHVDNTTEEEIAAWLGALGRLRPRQVMIYTIHRDTPLGNSLRKVPVSELNAIARKVNEMGIPTSVSG
ncbi:MAG: radical SAM protein [Bacteroidales bacterium]|jgi:wyosine [tRNA(Phe)-imidazoG37] synthetase (radical SAM superfamily)|nr:radical SAM protein [Bacteroidales bacterium]